MSHHGPLPDSFAETLFATLLVAWGNAFQDQYKGLDMAVIRADWARQLGGFFEPEADDGYGDAPAICWAMEHLPERPLNVMGFRKLCAQYLAPAATALPPPRGPVQLPPQVAKAFTGLRARSHEEPAQVRRARHTIGRLEHRKDTELSPLHRECLAAAQGLVRRYEQDGWLPT